MQVPVSVEAAQVPRAKVAISSKCLLGFFGEVVVAGKYIGSFGKDLTMLPVFLGLSDTQFDTGEGFPGGVVAGPPGRIEGQDRRGLGEHPECPDTPAWSECFWCLADQCCDLYTQCLQDPNCITAVMCIDNPEDDLQACMDKGWVPDELGEAFLACVDRNCASNCAGL